MLRWLAVAIGAVLPFAAVAALLALLWRKALRPRLPRRTEPQPQPQVRTRQQAQAGTSPAERD